LSPEITVGICAYNEGKNIGKLLGNILFEQNLKKDFEILVVCSGCTDNTVDIVNDFKDKSSKVQIYIENERSGKASAINKILMNAKGKAIIFISADTLPNKDCFNNLLKKLEQPKVGIVCGKPVPINSKKQLVGKLVHLLWGFHGVVFKELNDAGLAKHATELFCLRKCIINRIPDDTINDDAYIALMTKKKGWLIKYTPSSIVSICGPKTFYDYFNQRRRILVGHFQVKKVTGEAPQHLIYLLPHHPLKTLKLFLLLFKNNSLLTVTAFVAIELMLYGFAITDFIKNKSYSSWISLGTTKELIIDN